MGKSRKRAGKALHKKKLLKKTDHRLALNKDNSNAKPKTAPLKIGAIGSRGKNMIPVNLDKNVAIIDGKPVLRHKTKVPSHMFLSHNTALGPPYHILIDTNFINHSIRNKIDIHTEFLNCLYAKCTLYICDCVFSELEKLGRTYRVALRIAKDPRFKRINCGNDYADDCIVARAKAHRCFLVATCDKDFQRRIRKIPGVPLVYIKSHRYVIERLPQALGGGKS